MRAVLCSTTMVRSTTWTGWLLLASLLAGCPASPRPSRDGGVPCQRSDQCNAASVVCGAVRLCVQGFCSAATTIVACRDGAYPDAPPVGDCLTYEDCNPLPRCGSVVQCLNFRCDTGGPRIDIPCRDGGSREAGSDAAGDARVDAARDVVSDGIDVTPVDAGSDAALRDASMESGSDAGG